jgi:hypothetical protein
MRVLWVHDPGRVGQLIVLRSGYWPEPNETSIDAGIDLLDRYIVENYYLVHQVGGYELWLSRP